MQAICKKALSVVVFFALVLSLCVIPPAQADNDGAKSSIRVTKAFGNSASDIVSGLTTRQCVQQMILPAFRTWEGANVTSLNTTLQKHLAQHDYAGIILFAENFSSTKQSVKLTDQIQKAAASESSMIPYLIATDQEGGIVTRTSGCNLPGSMALAATGDTQNASTAGSITGKELKALGINVDFAPSLDVNSNPANPVIGVRSFSDDADTVASFGSAFIDGLHDGGVAASVKHFPGHGDTATDSHTGLPCVDRSLDELNERELVPFKAGIDSGADLVMTAHIQFPQVEKGTYKSMKTGEQVHLPATLSKTIVTDVLRGSLGFEGVVVSDSLIMDAVKDHFDAIDAATLAINAGVDVLLMPVEVENASDLQKLDDYVDNICARIGEGKDIDEATVRTAAEHVIQLKLDRGIITDTPENGTLSEKIGNAEAVVGSDENHATERQISQDAVTVTSDESKTLPLAPEKGQRVLLLASESDKEDALRFGFERLKDEGVIPDGVKYEVLEYGFDEDGDLTDVLAAVKRSDYVVCMSQVYTSDDLLGGTNASGRVDGIVAACNKADVPIVIMSCGLPYDAARFSKADACLLTYGSRSVVLDKNGQPVGSYGPNIPAGLDIAFGKNLNPVGKLPVAVPKLDKEHAFTDKVLYERGYGIDHLGTAPAPAVQSSPGQAPADDSLPIMLIAAGVVLCCVIALIVIVHRRRRRG